MGAEESPARSAVAEPRVGEQSSFDPLHEGSTCVARHDQSWVLVPPGDDDHDYSWKAYAKAQESKLDELSAKLAELTVKMEEMQRRLFGKKSERLKTSKLPPPLPPKSTKAEAAKKRADALALRDAKLETEVVPIPVPTDQCTCPDCGNPKIRRLGNGKPSTVYEYVSLTFGAAFIGARHSLADAGTS